MSGLLKTPPIREDGLGGTPGQKFDVETPAHSFIVGDFTPPAKGIGRDFRKTPSDQFAVRPGPELNDVVALAPADHVEKIPGDRIAPLDLPGVYADIVDPQRRAVGIDVGGGIAMAQFAARRHDPDVLDGAALQRPAEMPFAGTPSLRTVVRDLRDVEIPGADEAPVERHLAGTVGRGAIRAERVEKRRGRHAALRPNAFWTASAP